MSNREQFRPADHPHEHFLLTTVVGSYPKPQWLEREYDRAVEADETIDRPAEATDTASDDFEEALNDAARLITGEHERAGLDVVVDGEVRRTEMVEYFADRIGGYEFNGPVKVWGHNYFHKPSVIDRVSYEDSWLREEFAFTSTVATKPVKVPITGPYTLANWAFDEHYGDTADLAYDLADLVNEEVHTLIDAGARYVQIDEPALATTPDDHALVGECLDRIAQDIPDDVRLGVHVCYGDYSRIYPEILDYPVDEVDVELANTDFDQLEVFTDPEFTKDFALGVVDAHDATVESVEDIKDNIKRGLEVVPPEQLTVSPDCGLKLLPRSVAYRKMKNLTQAAREVEAELDRGDVSVSESPSASAD